MFKICLRCPGKTSTLLIQCAGSNGLRWYVTLDDSTKKIYESLSLNLLCCVTTRNTSLAKILRGSYLVILYHLAKTRISFANPAIELWHTHFYTSADLRDK